MVVNTKDMNLVTQGVEEIIRNARYKCDECRMTQFGKDRQCALFLGKDLLKNDNGEMQRHIDCVRIFGKKSV
jgi:hypothetical protein